MKVSLSFFAGALLLAFGCAAVRTSAAAQYGPNAVTALPGWEASHGPLDTMYTGYLDTDDGYNSHLFYWFAQTRSSGSNATSVDPSAVPIVLWLQGGPGCSGGLGWFLENGPYNLQADGSLAWNPYSWNTHAHFLFIDQPIGSGLSTLDPVQGTNATYATTIEQSTTALLTALLEFFTLHFPQYQNNPFFITGESYAGKYIPNLANAISNLGASAPMNLVGLAIGDGWVAPLDQTSVYGAQAYNLGLIDENQLAYVNQQFANCTALTEAADWHDAQVVCDALLNWIVGTAAGGLNVDDVREWGDDEHDNRLERYLSSPAVAAALSLVNPPTAYTSCSAIAGAALSEDEMKPSVHLLPALIDSLKMVYIYEGIFDLNCGVVGVEKYLARLFPKEYSAATRQIWHAPSSSSSTGPAVFGYTKQILPTLQLITIQGAGHMAPKTQPEASFVMIENLLSLQPIPTTTAAPNVHTVAEAASSHAPMKLRLPHLHHAGARPTSVLPSPSILPLVALQ